MGGLAERRTFLAKAAAFGGSLALGPVLAACARPPESQPDAVGNPVSNPSNPGSPENPSPASSKQEDKSIPAGWKQVKSPNYPYSVKIPMEWEHAESSVGDMKTDTYGKEPIEGVLNELVISPDPGNHLAEIMPGTVYIKVNNLDEFLKREISSYTISTEKIKVVGQDAWMIRNRTLARGKEYHRNRAIFFYEGQPWTIDFTTHPSITGKERERMKTVLDSFEFTGSYVKKDSSASSDQQQGSRGERAPEAGWARHASDKFQYTMDYPSTWGVGNYGPETDIFRNKRPPTKNLPTLHTAHVKVRSIPLEQNAAQFIERRKAKVREWKASAVLDSISSPNGPWPKIQGLDIAALNYQYQGYDVSGSDAAHRVLATSNRRIGVMDVFIWDAQRKRILHIQGTISFVNTLNDPEEAALRQDEAAMMKMIQSVRLGPPQNK